MSAPKELKILLGPLADLLPPLKRDLVTLVADNRDVKSIAREVVALCRAARVAVRFVRAARRDDVHRDP